MPVSLSSSPPRSASLGVGDSNASRLIKHPSLYLIALISIAFGSMAECPANPFELYGAGARSSAMGNTGVASARDYSGVFYNPATLTLATHSIGLNLTYALKDLEVKLSPRPEGYDIPDLGAQSPAVPNEYRLQPRQGQTGLNHTFTLVAGATTDLGTEKIRLGMIASLPVYHSRDSYPSTFNDEREQYFTNAVQFSLLGGRVEHFIVQFGMAYQLFPWLSLGIGASVMPDAFTQNSIYMPDASQQDQIDLNVGLNTRTQWRLQGGLLFIPNDRFRVGASYRDEQYMSIRGRNEVQVRGLQEGENYPFIQDMNIAIDYSPRQFTWGGTWIGDRIHFTMDIVYTLWSDYKGNHFESVMFDDTWSPRLGLEFLPTSGQRYRVGVRHEPTPVPEQTGRTNFVDNDRAVLSIGSGHELTIQEKTLMISWHAQFHLLLNRAHTKAVLNPLDLCTSSSTSICDEVPDDTLNPRTRQPSVAAEGLQTGNPGFPGYASGGWIGQFGVEVSWAF